MPYKIEHKKERKDKKWCVINKETGENKGCSKTKEKAEEHMSAIYANVKDA